MFHSSVYHSEYSFPGLVLSLSVSHLVCPTLLLSHLHNEVIVCLRHRHSDHSLPYFLTLQDIWPFTFSPHFKRPGYRWNHHTADSRHIVQECLRGIQECSWECSVLQQQLELSWDAWSHFLYLKLVCTCTHRVCARTCFCGCVIV